MKVPSVFDKPGHHECFSTVINHWERQEKKEIGQTKSYGKCPPHTPINADMAGCKYRFNRTKDKNIHWYNFLISLLLHYLWIILLLHEHNQGGEVCQRYEKLKNPQLLVKCQTYALINITSTNVSDHISHNHNITNITVAWRWRVKFAGGLCVA